MSHSRSVGYQLPSLPVQPEQEGLLARRISPVPTYLIFWALHAPLALWAVTLPQLATLHALVTLVVGIRLALAKGRLEHTVYVAAYIVGAEVFWRMTEARVFWEYGKYATALIFLLAALRLRPLKIARLLLMYLLLLMPATVPTLMQLDLNEARQQISFNLSGHVVLFVVALFFSNYRLSEEGLQRVLTALIAPTVAIATVALHSVLTSEIVWTPQSNFKASGGFGPNQVSTALSAGALAAILLLWLFDLSVPRQLALGSVALWFIIQAFLTFSRGGVVALAVAVAGVTLSMLLSRSRVRRLRMIATVAIGLLLLFMLVYPALDRWTQGALSVRFTDTNLTGRDRIAQASWQVFMEHPLTGVGVGLAPGYVAEQYGRRVAAHTEFARLVAEHGLIGVLALVMFLGAYLQSQRKVMRLPLFRHVSVAWLLWSTSYVLGNALRTAAPSFFLGLTFVGLRLEPDSSVQHKEHL